MTNEPKDPLLLDHEADGIKELDNNLPRWWVWLFYLTILFSVLYMGYYHVLKADEFRKNGGIALTEYKKEMERGEAIKEAAIAGFEETLDTLNPSADSAVLAQGERIYTMNCAPCHRHDGGGLVGPNLTDDYWIGGDTYADSLRVIWNGRPDKGMLAWKEQGMKPSEVEAVASYIYTLRGTELETPGKPPENQQPAADTGPSLFE